MNGFVTWMSNAYRPDHVVPLVPLVNCITKSVLFSCCTIQVQSLFFQIIKSLTHEWDEKDNNGRDCASLNWFSCKPQLAQHSNKFKFSTSRGWFVWSLSYLHDLIIWYRKDLPLWFDWLSWLIDWLIDWLSWEQKVPVWLHTTNVVWKWIQNGRF